jgi:adenylate cyclase
MTARILVVDDEPDLEALISQRFRRAIARGEKAFVFAHDGIEALDALKINPDIELVLSDINMPRMDGLTLLGELSARGNAIKTVIVSAYGDMENIRTAMNRGAFDFLTKPIEFRDFELTVEKTLNELAGLRESRLRQEKAERARANLARYFPPNVVELLAATDEPFGEARKQKAAIMFADMVGFTALSASETPERVFSLLRDLFELLGGEVFRFGGTVDKYMGDGLMASFGAPVEGTRDAGNALACALAIRAQLADWNRERIGDGEKPVKLAIGVHYGSVMLGNIGDARRLEFATIGDTVNVASRIERLARPLDTDIVLSEALVAAASAENPANPDLTGFAPVPEQSVPGFERKFTVWIARGR